MDLDQKTAQEILNRYSLGKVLSLKKQTRGITGSVFNINDKFILKIEGSCKQDEFRIERNAAISAIFEKNEIPCSKVVALDTSKEVIGRKYVIMTRLEGDTLVDVWNKLPTEDQRATALEYGEIMARIHQIKMKKFGDVINNDQQYDSWHDFITGRYGRSLSYLDSNFILSAKTLARVHNLLKDNDGLFHINSRPVLVHADFKAKNIKYHQGKINGIFDFDECLGGHNEFEFTKVFLPYTVDRFYKDMIIEGYKKIGSLSRDFPQRVRLYSLGFLLNVLWFSHSNELITPTLKAKYLNGVNELLSKI